MSGVGRSGRGVSLCALGIFGGSGRGLRVVLGVEKGSGGCQVCPCVWHHTHSRQSPDPQFVKGLKWVRPQEYGFPPDYWTESHKQHTKLKLMYRSTTLNPYGPIRGSFWTPNCKKIKCIQYCGTPCTFLNSFMISWCLSIISFTSSLSNMDSVAMLPELIPGNVTALPVTRLIGS